jgi:hypothetical protein
MNNINSNSIDETVSNKKKPKSLYVKQIAVRPDIHSRLRDLKVHPRESFNDVIERIMEKAGVI